MKRMLLVVAMGLSGLLLAEECIETPHFVESCLQVDNSWVLVLDDYSCWELSPMQPKVQSWCQWLRGTQLTQLDERFLVDLITWKRGDAVEVTKPSHSPVEGHPYLLHHVDHDQLVCGRLLPSDRMCVPKTQIAKALQQVGLSTPRVVHDSLDLQKTHFLILDDNTI